MAATCWAWFDQPSTSVVWLIADGGGGDLTLVPLISAVVPKPLVSCVDAGGRGKEDAW